MAVRKRFLATIGSAAEPGPALAALLADIRAFALETQLPSGDIARLAIAIEEVASNALRHGKAHRLTIEISLEAERMEVRIVDDGSQFDPTDPSEFNGPDPSYGGGVGLEMVRSWSDPMEYLRDGQTNVLKLCLARRS